MSTYLIDLRTLDERVTNVIDIQFLHGYYEPTVLILFEPLPTWTWSVYQCLNPTAISISHFFLFSRVAVRKDTCNIVAISLNLQEKTHPIIWSHGNLPFDCLQTFPVPKPIGWFLSASCLPNCVLIFRWCPHLCRQFSPLP
jgi:cleavage and polyadenylation specificity factor subunit 1